MRRKSCERPLEPHGPLWCSARGASGTAQLHKTAGPPHLSQEVYLGHQPGALEAKSALPRRPVETGQDGCFLEGERLQGRWGGGTERGLCGQFYVAFLAGRELQRGVCKSEGGDVWATATGQSLWPLWVCAHLPPLLPCPGLPDCPRAVLLPSVGNGDFPAALARGAVALRDVLVSVGPGISAEASRGRGGF